MMIQQQQNHCPHLSANQDIAFIFGLHQSLNEYRIQVEKAQWWLHLRTALEEDKLRLASFTPTKLHHSSKKKLFEKNVPRVINISQNANVNHNKNDHDHQQQQQQLGGRMLLNVLNAPYPTLLEESTRLNLFMFICFSLSDNDFAKIEQYGLEDTFHRMLAAVVRDVSLQPALANKFKATIQSLCGDDPASRILLDLVNGKPKKIEEDAPNDIHHYSHHHYHHNMKHKTTLETGTGAVTTELQSLPSLPPPLASPSPSSSASPSSSTTLKSSSSSLFASLPSGPTSTNISEHQRENISPLPPLRKRVRVVTDTSDEIMHANLDKRKKRKIPIMFSNASPNLNDLFGARLFQAIQASKQWEMFGTDCITVFIPVDEHEDISINLRVGRKEGCELLKQFRWNRTWLNLDNEDTEDTEHGR